MSLQKSLLSAQLCMSGVSEEQREGEHLLLSAACYLSPGLNPSLLLPFWGFDPWSLPSI